MKQYNSYKVSRAFGLQKSIIVLFLLGLSIFIQAQDSIYARRIMLKLGSEEFGGRGYVDNGNKIAADFVRSEFQRDSLKFFGNDYYQKFSIPINTIQDVQYLKIDNKTLIPGTDYYIHNASKSLKGKYELLFVDDSLFVNDMEYMLSILNKPNLKKTVLVFSKANRDIQFGFKAEVAGLVFRHKQLPPWGFSHAQQPVDYAIIDVLESKLSSKSKEINIKFKAKYYKEYPTQNIIGYVLGKKEPDSFIVIGAHYDHMGKMGHKVYFPGGNDNASGSSMMLNFAKYYSEAEHQPDYSIVFLSFSGEEVGLLGSVYYVRHPLFDMRQIKFMMNLDMVGTGSKGIVVVNGTVFKKEFARITEINNEKKYLPRVKVRGESCNSDHCPFYMSGVPSFFIYTTGDEYKEYHSPKDKSEDVPLTNYNGVFRLVRDFIDGF